MDGDPDFLRAREPTTDLVAVTAARLILHAELNLGGEIVPVGEGDTLDEQIARATGNVRRLAALVEGRHPQWAMARRLRLAVESSDMFCVAVSLSAAEIGSRPAWSRARERRRDGRRPPPDRSEGPRDGRG